MLAKRVLVAAILLPIGLYVIYLGGAVFAGVVALILALAAWEYTQLVRAGGLQPASVIVLLGTLLFSTGRLWNGFDSAPWMASLVILAGMAYHLFAYERGRDKAGTDFGVTLGGVFYIGWLGAYLISLRELPGGMWWLLLVLPAVWLADAGAYFIGKGIGRHKISPRLSPKKTWEGYLGGIVIGTLGSVGLAYGLKYLAGGSFDVSTLQAVLVGFTLSVLGILGDLGESMFKRQVGVKDSSSLLPGHGGVFDRIDSWLWAGVIGYYLVVLFA